MVQMLTYTAGQKIKKTGEIVLWMPTTSLPRGVVRWTQVWWLQGKRQTQGDLEKNSDEGTGMALGILVLKQWNYKYLAALYANLQVW